MSGFYEKYYYRDFVYIMAETSCENYDRRGDNLLGAAV